jgi:hypothetical protein
MAHSMVESTLRDAHAHCNNNKSEIAGSNWCGCFYCKSVFRASEVVEWIPPMFEHSALCPRCGIDSVIGDAAGLPLDDAFLSAMHACWFAPAFGALKSPRLHE